MRTQQQQQPKKERKRGEMGASSVTNELTPLHIYVMMFSRRKSRFLLCKEDI